MATSFDFTIQTVTDVPGISLVVAQNEDAFSYLIDENGADMAVLADGSAPIASDLIGDFVSDAGWDKFSCSLV